MKILAIETSCDETAVAILDGNPETQTAKICSSVVSSQIKLHAQWGGVVPNLAAREHTKNIVPVLETALRKAQLNLTQIDLIAVTESPGLIPALLIGTNAAKALSFYHKKPILGVHHIEAHILGTIIDEKNQFDFKKIKYPLLALVVSGGHTQLIYSQKPCHYQIIGQTQDDAVGEAFDKVAKMLELGYPGGPIVSQKASQFEKNVQKLNTEELKIVEKIKFPRPMLNSKNLDFSFSGLKTAVLYQWQKMNQAGISPKLKEIIKGKFCLEFEMAATEVLVKKTLKALAKNPAQSFILAGGVAANQRLRKSLEKAIKQKAGSTEFFCPQLSLSGDNAAMVAAATFVRSLQTKSQPQGWQEVNAQASSQITDYNL